MSDEGGCEVMSGADGVFSGRGTDFSLSADGDSSCMVKPTSIQMQFVEPYTLFKDLRREHPSGRQRLLCLYIGTKYITFAVSDDPEDDQASLLRILPRDLSVKLIAGVLQTLVLHNNVGGIIFGNCIQSENNRMVVKGFANYLCGTGKFCNMKYTHWNSPRAVAHIYPIIPKGLCGQVFESNTPKLNVEEQVEKSLALGVLQTYLRDMEKKHLQENQTAMELQVNQTQKHYNDITENPKPVVGDIKWELDNQACGWEHDNQAFGELHNQVFEMEPELDNQVFEMELMVQAFEKEIYSI